MQNLPEPEKGGSRLSSLDYSRTNDGKIHIRLKLVLGVHWSWLVGVNMNLTIISTSETLWSLILFLFFSEV